METTKIAVFKGRQVRKTLHNNEWWFSVEDVVAALTDSSDSKQYINRMRQRDLQLAEGWVQFVHTLLMDTTGGPQKVNCANTEGIFRIAARLQRAGFRRAFGLPILIRPPMRARG